MIYGSFITNKALISETTQNKDDVIDIYIYTSANLRKVITILNEHYIPMDGSDELSDKEKEKLDKQRKEEQENENKNKNQKNVTSEGSYHIDITVKSKKSEFVLHIRNSVGASQDILSQPKHGPTVKFKKKGLTDNRGVPIIVSTGRIVENNIDPSIVRTIYRNYSDALDLIHDIKQPINKIWFSQDPNVISTNVNKILKNISDDKNFTVVKTNLKQKE